MQLNIDQMRGHIQGLYAKQLQENPDTRSWIKERNGKISLIFSRYKIHSYICKKVQDKKQSTNSIISNISNAN
jgi:hypothetical protein